MALLTRQHINSFYQEFKEIDVTFTNEVIDDLKLLPKHVYLKCNGNKNPVIIYSVSMVRSKLIINKDSEYFGIIHKVNNLVALRFAFSIEDKKDNLLFFVYGKTSNIVPYENGNFSFIDITYTKRPPDDLIMILGQLLQIRTNSKKRNNERIEMTDDSIRTLGLLSKNAKLLLGEIPRNCIIRDLSFNGAKIILLGIAKFLNGKECVISMIANYNYVFSIRGKVIRVETVADRKDIAVLVIKYDEDSISMNYKKMINNYITVKRNASGIITDGK